MPDITGTFDGSNDNAGFVPTGAFYPGSAIAGDKGGGGDRSMGFDASRCTFIYGNSTTVQPPSIRLMAIVKF